jgi:hypothetical protein
MYNFKLTQTYTTHNNFPFVRPSAFRCLSEEITGVGSSLIPTNISRLSTQFVTTAAATNTHI